MLVVVPSMNVLRDKMMVLGLRVVSEWIMIIIGDARGALRVKLR